MSIGLIVTRGFSNGTLTGLIKDIVTMGYTIGVLASSLTGRATIITMTPDDRIIMMPPESRTIKLQPDNRRITFI